jgi:hypothetical protein
MIDTKRAICHSSFEPGNTLMIQRLFTTLLYVDAKTSGKQDQNGRGLSGIERSFCGVSKARSIEDEGKRGRCKEVEGSRETVPV